MCLIAEDLSQSAGYKQLQWSFNLSVCLIASDLCRYAGYELFQWSYSPRGGGGLPFITDGVARRNFQKQPLKVTILGVALANFIP